MITEMVSQPLNSKSSYASVANPFNWFTLNTSNLNDQSHISALMLDQVSSKTEGLRGNIDIKVEAIQAKKNSASLIAVLLAPGARIEFDLPRGTWSQRPVIDFGED